MTNTPFERRPRARRAAVAAVTGVAVAGGTAVAVPARAEPARAGCGDRPATRSALERMTRVHKLTGAAIRIDDPACGTWTAASGVADRRTGRPMRADLRGRIGSVTKSFTATRVLQLADRGAISLDAPVDRYLPGLIDRNGFDGREITVRSLLRHTSGLPDHMDGFASAEEYTSRHFEPGELVARALDLPRPEGAWHYSTTNYVIAGLIVEKVTGHSLADEVQRGIVEPLGLRDTYWPGDEMRIRGPHPRGYVRVEKDGAVRWDDYTEVNTTVGGAGGALVSTLRDMNRFYGALLGGRLLSASRLAEMKATVAADPDRTWPGARAGLGLLQTSLRCGGDWWGHLGDLEGFTTLAVTGPSGRRVSVVFNENPSTQEAFDDELNIAQAALCER
ncbi:serine hydrolase domain-containing protein [Actinomadura roseirufa]|uniref:serine hydrolase domain-containing protein n=1 Tax=Actinomadura roseirufa TaxID=2094049 RepID=UPI001040E76C|nr:serine hydrolase domain-containing protein [Actinomadura roseirufa]